MSKVAKTEMILDVALVLLKSQGDYGMTMRQVASRANMSLSNVQYYFKTKDALLKAMADRYFAQCLDELKGMEPVQDNDQLHETLAVMLATFLRHGMETSDMCRIFREYWAISTRNDAIKSHVLNYYQEMAATLISKLRLVADSEQHASETVSVMIPYIEGYSITAEAMPENLARVTELITGISIRLLKGANSGC